MTIKQSPYGQDVESLLNSQKISSLLADGQYKQAAELLRTAQVASEPSLLASNLLTVAQRICLASAQSSDEAEWHRRAAQEAGNRTTELNRSLCEIVQAIDVLINHESTTKTEVVTLADSQSVKRSRSSGSVDPLVQSSSLWQGLTHFLKREPHPANRRIVSSALADVSEPKGLRDDENRLAVYTLGGFQVYRNGDQIENWPSRKGLLIFKYLVINREHPIHKEILMDLFWPDSEQEPQRNNLNVAIYSLRQTLRNGSPSFSHILFQNDCYFVNPDMNIWTDYETFSEYYRNGQRLEQQGEEQGSIRAYQAAESFYQGIFLPEDCYEEWTETRRQYLQTAYLSLLDRLGSYYLRVGDYPACISVYQKMLAVDLCLEEAHVRLMQCYSRQGQPYLALRQYERCEKALNKELDALPMRETTDLYGCIRAGEPV